MRNIQDITAIQITSNVENDLVKQFNPGDLLYGVEQRRAVTRELLKPKHGRIHCTIDEVNKHIVFPSKHASVRGKAVLKMDDDLTDESALKNFTGNFLNHLEKELDSKQFKDKLSDLLINRGESSIVRYNCQSGVRYIVSDANDAAILHFELDHIDFNNVFTDIAMQNRCFTTSEIREVVRLIKSNTSNANLENKIKFYSSGHYLSQQDFLKLITPFIDVVDLTNSPVKKTIDNHLVLEKARKKVRKSKQIEAEQIAAEQINLEVTNSIKRNLAPSEVEENRAPKKTRRSLF